MNLNHFTIYTQKKAQYSVESIHSEEFSFGSFSEFFSSNFGHSNALYRSLSNEVLNLRYQKIDSFSKFLNNEIDYSLLQSHALRIDNFQIFLPFNVKKFQTGTAVLFEQWIKQAKKHGVDITEEKEKFIQLQSQAIELIKNTIKDKRVFEKAFFILGNSFPTQEVQNNLKHYIAENNSLLSTDYYKKFIAVDCKRILDIGDKLSSLTTDILAKIRISSPHAFENIAEHYSNALKNANGDIKNFFVSKFESNILGNIELSKGQSIQKALVFEDDSILLIDRYDNHIIPKNNNELVEKLEQFYLDIIDYKSRKNPTFAVLFKNKYKEENDIERTLITVDSLLENYSILKQTNFNTDILNKGLEEINDYISATVKTFKIHKYASSILSSKYKHLLSDESLPFFEKFYEEQLDTSYLQNYIGKKLALLKNPEDFKDFVEQVHNNLFSFNHENTLRKVKLLDKEAIYDKDNIMIVEINSFDESKALGTDNWCISRNDYYFKSYCENENRQYFVFDFNRESKDRYSMIGITLTPSGTIHAAHDKTDDSVKNNQATIKTALTILAAQYDHYEDSLSEVTKERVLEHIKEDSPVKTHPVFKQAI